MNEQVLSDGRLKIRLDCLCGAGLKVVGAPHERIREIAHLFSLSHDTTKEGHGLCTPREAANARRRDQRRQMREHRERLRAG